jgi:hypothetical protein
VTATIESCALDVFWQNEAKFINKIKLDRILVLMSSAAPPRSVRRVTSPSPSTAS